MNITDINSGAIRWDMDKTAWQKPQNVYGLSLRFLALFWKRLSFCLVLVEALHGVFGSSLSLYPQVASGMESLLAFQSIGIGVLY